LREVIDRLKSLGISQLPVVDDGKLRGIVAEVDVLRHLVTGGKTLDSPVGALTEGDYGTVSPNTKIELLQNVLADAKVAIVTEHEEVLGIITKIDLIDYLAKHPPGAPSQPPPAVPSASSLP
jgi:cystathionine beta-synthase